MSSIEQLLEKYNDASKYILLVPTKTVMEISEFHKATVAEVKLSVEGGDAYPQQDGKFEFGKDRKTPNPEKLFSLSKTGLLRLSQAAGINWHPTETKRIDPMTDRNYCAFRAVGALQKDDGTWYLIPQTAEMDLEVEEDIIRDRVSKSAEKQDELTDPIAKERWIEQRVHNEMVRKRKFKSVLTETSAMLRVVRALLAIRSTYSRHDLDTKTFVVVRIVFAPNTSDPKVHAALMRASMQAVEILGGKHQTLELPAGNQEIDLEEAPAVFPHVHGRQESFAHPKEAEADPSPVHNATVEEPMPFTVEPPKPQSHSIKTLADYEALETKCDPKTEKPTMEMIEALVDLKMRKKYDAPFKKPMDQWLKTHRQKFVENLLAKPDA